MKEELYIDGKKADLGKTEISLNYNSNLLTDISKIVSNNSYTIKLPKTLNNLRIIDCVHIPSATSRFPYFMHAGILLRDGIVIVDDADVVLLAVNDYIEIALMWGNVNRLRPITEQSLRDLRYTVDDYILWNKGTENSKTFPRIDYGFMPDEKETWYHPAVSVKWIMDKITESSGVLFDLPQDRQEEMNNMFIPLLDRNDSDVHSKANFIELTPFDIFQTNYFKLFKFTVKEKGGYYCSMPDEFTLKNKSKKIKVQVTGFLQIEALNDGNFGLPNSLKDLRISIDIRNRRTNGSPILASVPAEVELLEGKRYKYSFSFKDCSFDMEPNAEISFVLDDVYALNVDSYTVNVVQGAAGSINIIPSYERIGLGDKYYYIPNLPNIKIIDFLKAITNMLGLFAIPTKERIELVSFDMLEDNKSKQLDWTKLLMKKSQEYIPKNLSYSLPNMAQVNRFKYKEDDTESEDTLGINDETLEYERTVVELPFAPCKMRNGIAVIPIYTYKDKKLEYETTTPRILNYSGVDGVFYGLAWSVLLDKYYDNYRRHVSDAKIITEDFKLTSVRLKNLDMSVPVYLKQYGSYFAIINIKTKQNDICEVKLLKL